MQPEEKVSLRESPADVRILFLSKACDLGLELSVDYWKLNSITVVNGFLLPLRQELYDSGQSAVVFVLLDIQSDYNLIRMKKYDQEKTAFRCHCRHFEYYAISFSLINAPICFYSMMTEIQWKFWIIQSLSVWTTLWSTQETLSNFSYLYRHYGIGWWNIDW